MAKYRKLGRTSDQRRALLKNQVTALIYRGKKGQTIEVECPVGTLKYKVVSFTRDFK